MEVENKHPFTQIEEGLKKEWLEKACEWITNHHNEYSYLIDVDYEDDTVGYEIVYETERMVENFREASEQW